MSSEVLGVITSPLVRVKRKKAIEITVYSIFWISKSVAKYFLYRFSDCLWYKNIKPSLSKPVRYLALYPVIFMV